MSGLQYSRPSVPSCKALTREGRRKTRWNVQSEIELAHRVSAYLASDLVFLVALHITCYLYTMTKGTYFLSKHLLSYQMLLKPSFYLNRDVLKG